jgi:hypothetical protein
MIRNSAPVLRSPAICLFYRPRARQTPWDIQADAVFVWDKAAVIGDTLKGTRVQTSHLFKGITATNSKNCLVFP